GGGAVLAVAVAEEGALADLAAAADARLSAQADERLKHSIHTDLDAFVDVRDRGIDDRNTVAHERGQAPFAQARGVPRKLGTVVHAADLLLARVDGDGPGRAALP